MRYEWNILLLAARFSDHQSGPLTFYRSYGQFSCSMASDAVDVLMVFIMSGSCGRGAECVFVAI
jgi:hypothetical protein